MSIPMSDNLLWLHGGTRADGAFAGAALCASGSEASALYLDAGKTYSELSGQSGWGLHILVVTGFAAGLSTMDLRIVHSGSSSPTTTTYIGGRKFLYTDLVAGKHYFIPFYAKSILRYLGAYAVAGGSEGGTGRICMWIGEGPGDAE